MMAINMPKLTAVDIIWCMCGVEGAVCWFGLLLVFPLDVQDC
jgi:hypothetical protein